MHLFLFVALICAACQPILGFGLKLKTVARFMQRCLPATLASIALIGQVDPAFASREVGNIPATGFVFKDYLKINAFSDPKVKGVELYVADFERPLTEKLGKDFFDDPSSSSLACAQVGPVVVAKDMSTSPEGEEVFEESRNLFFKQVRVRRVYDKETNTLVYASYSTRLDKGQDTNKGRFKSSLCAVHIKEL